MEKKQLKWTQDFQENYDPYGKPGVGVAPAKANTTPNTPLQSNPQNSEISEKKHNTSNLANKNRPGAHLANSPAAKTQKYRDSLEEYKAINDTLAKIIEAENKIKAEQIESLKLQLIDQQSNTPAMSHTSNNTEPQKMVPAAMRTSIMFGVRLSVFCLFQSIS